jgi:dTDP-4-dehydrorhamnose 3,5-epimerase
MPNTIEFEIKKTNIPGLLEIHMDKHEDSRGFFTEKFQKEKLVSLGFPENFEPVQENLSYNKKAGVTRGIHAEPWDKYISVIKGKVFAVFVDLRNGENFGKLISVTVDSNISVFVPKGVGNSFQTLEDDTYYSYLLNAHWSPELQSSYKSVNLADQDLNIQWPINLQNAIVSDKDKQNPNLKEIEPYI